MSEKVSKTEAEWRAQLSPVQYAVTREKATDGAKARLENFPIKKGTVKLNLDTSADEMRRMKMSDSEIANAQRIQREGMGK